MSCRCGEPVAVYFREGNKLNGVCRTCLIIKLYGSLEAWRRDKRRRLKPAY